MARALVTMAGDERAWGRPWHVPADRPVSLREAVRRTAAIAGVRPRRVNRMPIWVVRLAGLFDEALRATVTAIRG